MPKSGFMFACLTIWVTMKNNEGEKGVSNLAFHTVQLKRGQNSKTVYSFLSLEKQKQNKTTWHFVQGECTHAEYDVTWMHEM